MARARAERKRLSGATRARSGSQASKVAAQTSAPVDFGAFGDFGDLGGVTASGLRGIAALSLKRVTSALQALRGRETPSCFSLAYTGCLSELIAIATGEMQGRAMQEENLLPALRASLFLQFSASTFENDGQNVFKPMLKKEPGGATAQARPAHAGGSANELPILEHLRTVKEIRVWRSSRTVQDLCKRESRWVAHATVQGLFELFARFNTSSTNAPAWCSARCASSTDPARYL